MDSKWMHSNDSLLATVFCQNCGQPLKLDSSLLKHHSTEEAMASLDIHDTESSQRRTGRFFLPDTQHSCTHSSSRSLLAHTGHNATLRRSSFPYRSARAAPDSDPESQQSNTITDSFVMLPRDLSQSDAQPQLDSSSVPPLPHTPSQSTLDPPEDHRGNLSHRLKVANKLFTLVSDSAHTETRVDHPLCLDCADEVVARLEKTVGDAILERDTYQGFLDGLSHTDSHDPTQDPITQEELNQLRLREKSALEDLMDLERENEQILKDLDMAQLDLDAVDELEKSYWQDMNSLERELSNYQNQLESINLKYDQATKRLEVLSKTNVLQDAFRIWHDGPFGTINGLRLGRLSNIHVEWSEINAAMGQTVFLLDTLATKLSFLFVNYRLLPMGSFSKIERIDGEKYIYELYGSSDIVGMIFWNRRFDFGLIAFLNCVQQLGDFAEQHDSRFRLPYRINKDKIGDASIRLQFNQDEAWTKALKYTLINVKWMLAFCCSRIAT
ncbi:Vacuolar protein sorting-associated protein atg6 [Batrachochytrium dendrobatidis]|nr:Vacuolar protein sorting-associated protein atg6 [Batrachochytrium dendrobatidis]